MSEKCIAYKGGKCVICGYSKCYRALDFHHLNPSEKKFGISYAGHYRSWAEMQEELDKCILVCSNCHREIEEGVTVIS
jgi:5-methylcytosine-specific restriction endonuclease McrA